MMRYQLVLQWPASSIEDFDALIDVEDLLIEKLTEADDVDGHDAGSGEANIFIRTDDPKRTFNEIKGILGNHDCWIDVRVAYREIVGNGYTILWPRDLADFKVT